MKQLTQVNLKKPYLVFVGDVDSATYVKTAAGLVQWCKDDIAGQLRFVGNTLNLGVPDLSIEQAVASGVKSIIVGVAPVGGTIGSEWIEVLIKAAHAGMDVVSGLHIKLSGYPELVAAARQSGARLIDIRMPSKNLPIANGKKRVGKRLLMVGTECAVGKKYTALAICRALKEKGIAATFRATGQTGIMIAGSGIPIDSVIADFISGAAEVISPDNQTDHWDIIEGQGSLFNPSYSGVSLGLLHGSQPDAIIVCHDPSRTHISSCPTLPVATVEQCIDLNLSCGRIVNPDIQCIGVSINTSVLPEDSRAEYLNKLSARTGLPCFDPLACGVNGIDGVDVVSNKIIGMSNET